MVVIEELDEEGRTLGDSGELEEGVGELELEDNPGEEATGFADGPTLEANHLSPGCFEEEDDDDDEWEIPFAEDGRAALPEVEMLDIRLTRRGEERHRSRERRCELRVNGGVICVLAT